MKAFSPPSEHPALRLQDLLFHPSRDSYYKTGKVELRWVQRWRSCLSSCDTSRPNK